MSKKKKLAKPLTDAQARSGSAKPNEVAVAETATGYLPTASPPAKNLWLLVLSGAMLAGWLVFLGSVALQSSK